MKCYQCQTEETMQYQGSEMEEHVHITESYQCSDCQAEEKKVFYYNAETMAYQQVKPGTIPLSTSE